MDLEGVAEAIERLEGKLANLSLRVSDLEDHDCNCKSRVPVKTAEARVTEFFQSTPLWMTSRAVADNLEMNVSTISGAMERLFQKGVLARNGGSSRGASYKLNGK